MKKNLPVTGVEKSFADNANILSTTNLKGAITYTNDDFNDVSGFQAEDLLHKNHNVVRHPEMPPIAFATLWQMMKNGRPWMGIVKNRCKNGDHYWVDALVTPIIKDGAQVEYQSVRTKPAHEHVKRAEKLYAKLNQGRQPWHWSLPQLGFKVKMSLGIGLMLLLTLLLPVSMGRLDLASAGLSFLFGLILMVLINFRYIRPWDKVVQRATAVSDDAVASYVYTGRRDELGLILLAMQMLESNSGGIVGRISDVSKQLHSQANQLSSTLKENSDNIFHQRSETEQIAAAVNEMSASIQEVAQNAELAVDATRCVSDETDKGKKVVYQTTDSIKSLASEMETTATAIKMLEKDSVGISSVVDVIRGIADQTNLLALNAAIEAARAGDQGRGFAVVADEVRTLASRTQESTAEIQAMIENLQAAASHAVSVMEESRQKAEGSVIKASEAAACLDKIIGSVNTISDMTIQIATAAKEQSTVASEVDKNIITIRELAENIAIGTEKDQQACQTLNEFAERLAELSIQYNIQRVS